MLRQLSQPFNVLMESQGKVERVAHLQQISSPEVEAIRSAIWTSGSLKE